MKSSTLCWLALIAASSVFANPTESEMSDEMIAAPSVAIESDASIAESEDEISLQIETEEVTDQET